MAKPKSNGNEKNQPISIDTTGVGGSAWSQLDVLNQIMTPVQIINDNSLSFYTAAQIKFTEPTAATATTTTAVASNFAKADPSNFDSLNIPSNHHHKYNIDQYSNDQNYNSWLFNQQQSGISNNGALVLAHEPGSIKQQQQQQRPFQSLYSSNSTPINSTPTSPIVNFQQNYFEKPENSDLQHADEFETMFLSSNAISTSKSAVLTKSKGKKNAQKYRFKDDKQQLDSQTLSEHNRDQDRLFGVKRLKSKQKMVKKHTTNLKGELDDDLQQEDRDDDDVPVIGDGAQSYSSMGSNSSRTSQPLSKDDKRRRNTAASARFRIKKKMREQALQNTASEMTEKAQRMEQRVHELEREIKWLKALVVEKSEAKIERLVRERPQNSATFSNNTNSLSSSLNSNYLVIPNSNKKSDDDDEEEEEVDDDRKKEKNGHHQNQNYRRY
ncbi:hypothetical protein [Parasitella parasitica]|uniref:BZIP domain-containing protein n=1 Tax=Parasitella parasitica TaxID=35722 RepID=A0A0B7MU79_9FUNG|nr:hypothetical protein [Parasitella parasitica]